ncbi:MAG: T9SS type A sorting domain-containing protein [bacterium]|nr:T9SS type A sorting domain-containing protein [bacterium]
MHERDQTLAPLVTYDGAESYLHLEYVLDLDVGGVPQTEGATTLNNVYYQRIALSDPALAFTTPHDYTTPSLHIDGRQHTGTGAVPFDPNSLCTTPVGRDAEGLPTSFQLFQNFPNPFNPTTNIQFDLVNASKVTLKVYNVLGEAVATLVNGEALSAGAHTYAFDGASLASGVYMYRLEANGVSSTRKMMLMK